MLCTSLLLLSFFVLAEENGRYVLVRMGDECPEDYSPITTDQANCKSAAATFGIILGFPNGVEEDGESNHCTGHTWRGKDHDVDTQYWVCEKSICQDSTVPLHRPLGNVMPGHFGKGRCPKGFSKITNLEVCRRAANVLGVGDVFDPAFGLKDGEPVCNVRYAYENEVIARFSSDYGRKAELICEDLSTVAL